MTINREIMTKRNHGSGFTIVELLVVIVVIGILAAITIVAYTGISQHAIVSSLQSDLTNASKQFKLFQVDNMAYPTTINCALPDSATNKCIKSSSGNTYSDYQLDNTSNPQSFCLTSTNASGVSYRTTEDGTSKIGNCSRQSCYTILNANESYGSGIYWIKPAGTAFRVYCDMVTSGGGWTLLVTNPKFSYPVWNLTTIYSLSSNNPSTSSPYSILNQANSIKSNISGNLQYRIDADSFGHWGGVWQAPFANTFVGTTAVNNATNIEQYDVWTIDTNPSSTEALSNIMPWISDSNRLLTTWGNLSSWYGTLVVGASWNGGYTPYIYTERQTPNVIWYWLR